MIGGDNRDRAVRLLRRERDRRALPELLAIEHSLTELLRLDFHPRELARIDTAIKRLIKQAKENIECEKT